MAVRFNMAAEARRVQRTIQRYGDKVAKQALPRAMNKTATTVRSRGVKKIATEMGTVQRTVRKVTRIDRASVARPYSAIIWTGRPLTLIEFNARQTRRGVTAKAWGQRKLYRGGFIARMPTGKVQTVARKGRARLPLKTLYGPSVPRTAARDDVRRILVLATKERMPIEMKAAIRSVRAQLGIGR